MPPVTWAAALLALWLVILVHELGHFLAAVATGTRVDRFSVLGIGRPILRLGSWRGTEFVVGAVPFGAYLSIGGLETEPGGDAGEQTFHDQPLWARTLVIAGGPLANYVGAMVLLFALFATTGMPGRPEAIEVAGVRASSAAEGAGIRVGDTVVQIGDVRIDPARAGRDVGEAARRHRGTTVPVTVLREGAELTLQAALPDGDLPLGVMIAARPGPRQRVDVGMAAAAAVRTPIVTSAQQLSALWRVVTGRLDADMQGPVGIAKEMARSADAGLVPLLATSALISTLIGLFNLLPLPGLDGSYLVFLAYEAVVRRRVRPGVVEAVQGYGIMALLVFIALVTVGDLRHLFGSP